MKNAINNLLITKAYRHATHNPYYIRERETRALVIRLGDKVAYEIEDKTFILASGDAIFIPSGATYTAKPVGNTNEFMIVRFVSDEPGEWELMHVDDIEEAAETHRELCRALVFDDRKSRMRALSLFYKLLSLLSEGAGEETYLPSHKLTMIRPALDYVETNIFSPRLKIGDLHKLVHLSDVYFRDLFIAHTGMTPQAYVTEKRMDYAKEVIEGGGVKIKDVAEMVGYTDALYFSRIYKKRYGHSPRMTKKPTYKKTSEKTR